MRSSDGLITIIMRPDKMAANRSSNAEKYADDTSHLKVFAAVLSGLFKSEENNE